MGLEHCPCHHMGRFCSTRTSQLLSVVPRPVAPRPGSSAPQRASPRWGLRARGAGERGWGGVGALPVPSHGAVLLHTDLAAALLYLAPLHLAPGRRCLREPRLGGVESQGCRRCGGVVGGSEHFPCHYMGRTPFYTLQHTTLHKQYTYLDPTYLELTAKIRPILKGSSYLESKRNMLISLKMLVA